MFLNVFSIAPARGKIPSPFATFSQQFFFCVFVAITPAHGKLPFRLDPLRGENCFFVFLPKPMLVENPPPRLQSVWRKNLSLNLFAITPVHRISPSRLDLRAFVFHCDAGDGPIQSANECSPAQTKHRIPSYLYVMTMICMLSVCNVFLHFLTIQASNSRMELPRLIGARGTVQTVHQDSLMTLAVVRVVNIMRIYFCS